MQRRSVRRDRMIGLFVAGAVLLDPPILNLAGGTIFGWPALYLYFFAVWLLLIIGIAFVTERGARADRKADAPPE